MLSRMLSTISELYLNGLLLMIPYVLVLNSRSCSIRRSIGGEAHFVILKKYFLKRLDIRVNHAVHGSSEGLALNAQCEGDSDHSHGFCGGALESRFPQ